MIIFTMTYNNPTGISEVLFKASEKQLNTIYCKLTYITVQIINISTGRYFEISKVLSFFFLFFLFFLRVRPNESSVFSAVPQFLKFLIKQENDKKCCLFSFSFSCFLHLCAIYSFCLDWVVTPPDSCFFKIICVPEITLLNILKEIMTKAK